MKIRSHKQKGFTIIEAIVAASVFAIAIVSSLGVYIATLQLDQKSRAERDVLQNGRFIMEYLSKEIRNGSIDYANTTSSVLSIRNQQDEILTFFYSPSSKSLQFTRDGSGTTLNSGNVKVSNFQFILNPTTDPFDLVNDAHTQPHVTIILSLDSANSRVVDSAHIDLHTTVGVRDYRERY
ncbi:MAG: prepilin-type N-terminal cleavage/methylation domain-containing protein [Candidatus Doudnabacteria bacterium]|nr:prepilin-type N-terminal cleavage/methylation domain-containing protein [Candidatus Doudnabacteria bacterium]